MHLVDPPKPVQKTYVPYISQLYHPMAAEPVDSLGPAAYNLDRHRHDARRRPPHQMLISPMKFASPCRDKHYLYQEALANQLHPRRLMNTVSPHKMLLQDMASGQANIGTPSRSRIMSHDSSI